MAETRSQHFFNANNPPLESKDNPASIPSDQEIVEKLVAFASLPSITGACFSKESKLCFPEKATIDKILQTPEQSPTLCKNQLLELLSAPIIDYLNFLNIKAYPSIWKGFAILRKIAFCFDQPIQKLLEARQAALNIKFEKTLLPDVSGPMGHMSFAFPPSEEHLKILLYMGADVNAPMVAENLQSYGIPRIITPLTYATLREFHNLISLFIKFGANVNQRIPRESSTALMIAMAKNSTLSTQLLLQAGADKTLRNSEGLTAFDMAKTTGAILKEKIAEKRKQKIISEKEKEYTIPLNESESDTEITCDIRLEELEHFEKTCLAPTDDSTRMKRS